MNYVEQIQQLWEDKSSGDLSTILQQLLQLLEEAHSAEETIPHSLELEILLQANYALGFGGTISEARRLAGLFHTILMDLTSVSPAPPVDMQKFHRLACTLASALLSLLSSDEYQQISTAYDILSWESFGEDDSVLELVVSLTDKLVISMAYGPVSTWKLELLTFIITLHLIQQDLDGSGLSETAITELKSFLQSVDQSSPVWEKWQSSWLEYSDYYRFVTLMLTNTSSPEEIWLDEIEVLLT